MQHLAGLDLVLNLALHGVVQGGGVLVPNSPWSKRNKRRVLIYLGADTGAELDYVISVDRDEHKK